MQTTAKLYLLLVGVAGFGLVLFLSLENRLPVPGPGPHSVTGSQSAQVAGASSGDSLAESLLNRLRQNAGDPLTRFFLQLSIVILACNVIGWIFTRCGQPAVVGEMMAGVLLGPSLFGLVAPHAFQFVFAASSLEPLRLLSQVGVCLFMFAVGMEMDWVELRQKASAAILISHAGIAIPSLLAVGLAPLLYERLAQPGASFLGFALFLAISMSITAFPVLVRILQDRGILLTPLGQMASACAAAGDATAWGLLAFVVAIAKGVDFASDVVCLILCAVFVTVMFAVVKPNLSKWIGEAAFRRPAPSRGLLAIIIAIVLAAASCTQLLGIHALFGAFVAGLVMPNTGGFRSKLGVRLENVSSVLLLPVFFASSGLRTEIGLIHGRIAFLVCLLIIALATLGKLGGTSLAARLTGIDWREALQLGALMNTRGLMELIALNLGYELHILSGSVFSMLVIMALVTTIMTGPLLWLFGQSQESSTCRRNR